MQRVAVPPLTVSADIVFQLLSKLIQTDSIPVASDNNTSRVYCCHCGRTHSLKLGKTDHPARICKPVNYPLHSLFENPATVSERKLWGRNLDYVGAVSEITLGLAVGQ